MSLTWFNSSPSSGESESFSTFQWPQNWLEMFSLDSDNELLSGSVNFSLDFGVKTLKMSSSNPRHSSGKMYKASKSSDWLQKSSDCTPLCWIRLAIVSMYWQTGKVCKLDSSTHLNFWCTSYSGTCQTHGVNIRVIEWIRGPHDKPRRGRSNSSVSRSSKSISPWITPGLRGLQMSWMSCTHQMCCYSIIFHSNSISSPLSYPGSSLSTEEHTDDALLLYLGRYLRPWEPSKWMFTSLASSSHFPLPFPNFWHGQIYYIWIYILCLWIGSHHPENTNASLQDTNHEIQHWLGQVFIISDSEETLTPGVDCFFGPKNIS